jgi:hypothetical protein
MFPTVQITSGPRQRQYPDHFISWCAAPFKCAAVQTPVEQVADDETPTLVDRQKGVSIWRRGATGSNRALMCDSVQKTLGIRTYK